MRSYIFIVFFAVAARLCASLASATSAVTSVSVAKPARLSLLGRRFAALRRGHARHVGHIALAAEKKSEDASAGGGASGAVVGHESTDSTAGVAKGTAFRRPIITGCLKECGYEEQTCVTQCQVCVERSECRILGKCDPCLREAHAQKLAAKKIDTGILDNGGVSMMRDGMLAEMTRAKLQALDRKREVRSAREVVLKAQREAEWAAEERHLAASHLIEARQVLRDSNHEVTRWKLQNEKKLKSMRARAREQRQKRQKAERKLAAAKRKYSKAQRKLRIASNSSIAKNKSADGEDNDEVWRQVREVERQQEAVERAEKDVEMAGADAEWLDRGLRRRVKSAQSGASRAREELLVARAHERVSRERLEEAKVHYVMAVQASQNAEKAAQDSEQRLRKAPVSPYPEAKKANLKDDHKEKLLRSLAPYARVSWLPLLVILMMSWAA